MFKLLNYFRQYDSEGRIPGEPIKDYKLFYRDFSQSREFGGSHYGHIDHFRKLRFFGFHHELIDIILSTLPRSILDIGCGAGVNVPLGAYFSSFAKYTGLDYASGTIQHISSIYPSLEFGVADAFDLSNLHDFFDCVILSSLLILYEDLDDRIKLLKEAASVLSNRGFIISVIWHDAPLFRLCVMVSRWIARLSRLDLPEDFMGICLTKREALDMFAKSGLRVVRSEITGKQHGVMQAASYLSLRKYKRTFGKGEKEAPFLTIISKLDDMCFYDNKVPSFLIKLLNLLPTCLLGHFAVYAVVPLDSSQK